MKLTKQQRAYIKAQKQAFKLYNSIFIHDSIEGIKDAVEEVEEDVLGAKKDYGNWSMPYFFNSTLTKEAIENLTNPDKNERCK